MSAAMLFDMLELAGAYEGSGAAGAPAASAPAGGAPVASAPGTGHKSDTVSPVS